MEPTSALHITGTALTAEKAAWDVSQTLYTFVNDAKKIDKTMQSFAGEIQALGTACRTVGNCVERVMKECEIDSSQDGDPEDGRDDLWSCLSGQIDQCQKTILELQEAVSCAKRDYQKVSNFLNQAIRQIMLKMKTDDISEARSQILSHISSLNILLLAFAIDLTYVGPQRADTQLPAQINELTTKRDILENGRVHGADGELSQDRRINDVLKVTTKIIHSAEALYAGGVADGSVYGDVDPQKEKYLHAWIEDIHNLDEIQANKVHDTSNDDDRSVCGEFASPAKSPILDWMSRTKSMSEDASEPSYTSSLLSSPRKVNSGLISDSTSTAPSLHTDKSDHFPPDSGDQGDEHDENDNNPDDDLLVEALEEAMLSSREAFEQNNYTEARSTLKEALRLARDLPIHKQATCDRYDVSFMLAVCEFHLEAPEDSEPALLHVIENIPKAKLQDQRRRLHVCEAGHLLAQVYIRLSQIEKARMYCDSALQGRRRLLGKDNSSTVESMALMCRILELEGKTSRANIYFKMIPEQQRASLVGMYLQLGAPSLIAEGDQSTEAATLSSPQSPATPQMPQIERALSLSTSAVRETTPQPVSRVPSQSIAPPVNEEYVRQSKEYRNPALVELVKSKGYVKPKPADAVTRHMWTEFFDTNASSDLATALLESRNADALKLAGKSHRVGAFMRRTFTRTLPDLHLAALFGELEVVRILIKKGSKPSLKSLGTTALHCAAYGGYADIVKLLITSGSPVDPNTSSDGTPLMIAVVLERLDVIDMLLRYGADPRTENETFGSAMHCACTTENPLLVEAVSRGFQGLDFSRKVDLQRITKTQQAVATRNRNLDLQMPLLDVLNSERLITTITQPLGVAAYFGRKSVLEYLFDKGLEIINKYTIIGNAKTKSDGHTMVTFAAINGQTDTLRFLIEHGASIASTESEDYLYYAAINQKHDCEDLLLEKGASIQAATLYSAIKKGNLERLLIYLSYDSSPQLLRDTLLLSIRYRVLDRAGAEKCLRILLSYGITLDITTNEDGFDSGTLLHIAVRINDPYSVLWLLRNGAEKDDTDSEGWTPLMIAAYDNRVEIVKHLLLYHASKEIRNKSGRSAFDYAYMWGNKDIRRLFNVE